MSAADNPNVIRTYQDGLQRRGPASLQTPTEPMHGNIGWDVAFWASNARARSKTRRLSEGSEADVLPGGRPEITNSDAGDEWGCLECTARSAMTKRPTASEYPAPARRTEDDRLCGRRIPDQEQQNRPGPDYDDEATIQLDTDAAARNVDH